MPAPTLVRAGSFTGTPAATAAYARALAAGAPDSLTSSYRDPDEQMALYVGWVRRLAGYNFALHPDLSDHCKGLAADLRGAAAKAWWRTHPEFGFVFTDPTEDWHIAYRIAYDRRLADLTPPTPIAPEDDMYTDQDRERDAEALRLLRLVVLAPSGGATPLTAAETKYVQIVQGDTANAAEARRQGGVLLGAIKPSGAERTIAQQVGA